jgi:hypothetical protein
MKTSFLIILLIFLTGCSQKYFKDNIEIKKDEYLFYKNRCERNYQKYSNQYGSGGLYAIGQKRYHDEYMRECMEIINKISLKKKEPYIKTRTNKTIEINLLKMDNSLLKISK